MKEKNKLKKVECKKCGEKWLPRVCAPKKCPGCQTREWDAVLVYRPVAGPARRVNRNKKVEAMKTMLAFVVLMMVAGSAFASTICNQVGGTTFCNDGQGSTVMCHQVGSTTFCN